MLRIGGKSNLQLDILAGICRRPEGKSLGASDLLSNGTG
jgi:hypothetical protein